MTKRDRVRATIDGGTPDRTPAGFWYHFSEAEQSGPAAVDAHAEFLRSTDVDLLKIMNENLYRVDAPPRSASEWRSLPAVPLSAPFYQRQLDIVRRVLDAVGDSAYSLVTVHGIFASAFHALNLPEERFEHNNPVEQHLVEDPSAVAEGLRSIGESLVAFARACIEAGVDGIYYAALGGERWRAYPSSTFQSTVQAIERVMLDILAKEDADLFVHICKGDVDLAAYADYPGDVFNWACYANDLSLRDGYELFQRPILGGFDDRSGVLVDGTLAEIASEARSIVAAHADFPFILGADCTLPTNLDSARIRAAVKAIEG